MATDGEELTPNKLPRETWLRAAGGPEPAGKARRQKLLAVQHLNLVWQQLRGEWSWLAVIPGEPELSTADFAHALSQVGTGLSARPVGFVEATNVDLDSAAWLVERLGSSAEAQDAQAPRTLVSLANPIANPFALPVSLAADGVIVCVRRGRTPLASVRETIEAIGADRVVCSVLVG